MSKEFYKDVKDRAANICYKFDIPYLELRGVTAKQIYAPAGHPNRSLLHTPLTVGVATLETFTKIFKLILRKLKRAFALRCGVISIFEQL